MRKLSFLSGLLRINCCWHVDVGFIADIDECLNGAASCSVDTDCVNSMGSFSCDCGPGYEQDPLDASSCIGRWFLSIRIGV